MMNKIIFLIQCKDRKGLLAEITSYFYKNGFNILHCQQYTNSAESLYFMRIELDLGDLKTTRRELKEKFAEFAKTLDLKWDIHFSDRISKIAIMVSKASHCLYDLILREQRKELHGDINLIISNHPTLEYVGEQFGIPFFCFPVDKENKHKQEKEICGLLEKHHIDLIVLARYMQILSESFVSKYEGRIINIHHAFLPAFVGANPYLQAYRKGVKMIGATAHYATAELDQGPIIEQDVERVTHEHTVEDLKQIGRDIESKVLAKAVKAHLEHRIIISDNKTIVFN